MKYYTTIANTVANKLSSADTYRYTCLTFTPRKNGYTDSTFKQIAEININPEPELTIKKFVQRLKLTDILKIEETFFNGKKRNKYFITDEKINFRMVSSQLLKVDLQVELKGFLIQLFTLCLNNTFECNLSLNKIVELIKISKPTAGKYLKVLLEKEMVFKTDSGYRLNPLYFLIGKTPKQKQIEQIFLENKGCEQLLRRFIKTDWKKINRPAEYWLSVVCGFTGKKVEKIEAGECLVTL